MPGVDESTAVGDPPREQLAEVAPSAKLVYLVLDREGTATQAQLSAETRLPRRTVRSALERLEDADLVGSERHLLDARRKVYHARPVGRREPTGPSGR